jgi:hydroxypyruvate isomerase
VPIAKGKKLTPAVERLNNRVAHDGYFLVSSVERSDIVDEVGGPAVKLLFNACHQQVSEGDLIGPTGRVGSAAHLHVADVPGRHAHVTGEINYRSVLRAAARAVYDGFGRLHYAPRTDRAASLREILGIIDAVNRAQTK